MPRSKNPNPRQVMEGEETDAKDGENLSTEAEAHCDASDAPSDHETYMDVSQSIENGSEKAGETQNDITTKRDSLAALTARKFAAVYDDANEDGINPEHGLDLARFDSDQLSTEVDDPNNGDMQITPRISFSFSPSSPPSFFTIGSRSLQKVNGFPSATNDAKKPKCSSPGGVLNPRVMTWMRNRFHMRPGGKISASDIIALYEEDTKHLENPPPVLQNYQVGQLLRRVFPDISRCKITVNSKRHWVYKHLNHVENPPEDLFEEQPFVDAPGIGESELHIADIPMEDKTSSRASDSPSSNFEEGGMEGNGGSPPNIVDAEDGGNQKSNAILLGLLGTRIKDEPLSPSGCGGTNIKAEPLSPLTSGGGANRLGTCVTQETFPTAEEANPKKKRDSEVVVWLRDNYKFKPGYYVKSMDLLRKYNNGRVEMVKYLSQVGRVMKHVFPAVRHLRKSFKGGKREWVYLNLKPVDVDSDSEEGKSMMMPMVRRSVGWQGGSTNIASGSLGQPSGRVNISHTPLSLVHNHNGVFKPKGGAFHRISQMGGNKLVIRRSLPTHLGSSTTSITTLEEGTTKRESLPGNVTQLQNLVDRSAGRTRIILYNKQESDNSHAQDEGRSPELERDIFAPITKFHQVNGGSSQTHFTNQYNTFAKRKIESNTVDPATVKLSLMNDTVPMDQNTMSSTSVEAYDDAEADHEVSGLDLTVKRISGGGQGNESQPAKYSEVQDSNRGAEHEALNLTTSSIGQPLLVSPGTVKSGELRTIHYRPANGETSSLSTFASDKQSKISPSTQHYPNVEQILSLKQKYLANNGGEEEIPISFQALQNFNAQRFGWLRSPQTSVVTVKNGLPQVKKKPRFIEWFSFSGQWLVDKQRALREIKIYDDWTVVIHALGRRVYPNDLGGITDLEKTVSSMNKVFRVLAEAKLCMGFPAPSVSDLYIHGILVSKFEVWSSREDNGEDIRQRAVNCQILYSGQNTCCNKCARILKLHQQQRKGTQGIGKRPSTEPLVNVHFRPKQAKV